MSDEVVVFEIARFSKAGDQLLERYELLSNGTSSRRRSLDGSTTRRTRGQAAKAIAADPDLCTIRAGQRTRITTSTLVDELPLILSAWPTLPENIEDGGEDPAEDAYGDDEFDEPVGTYNDREVEVNGQRWSIFDGVVLPTESPWSGPLLAETWADLLFDAGSSPFSDGRSWAAIGLINPAVVVTIRPNWNSDGQIVEVKRRGSDANDIVEWFERFGPGEDWGTGSGLDSQRIRAQLFVEAAATIGERRGVRGDHLAAGITDYAYSFGIGGWWDLTLTTTPEVVGEVLDLLAEDDDVADIIAAGRDPQHPLARARRAALDELSSPS